LAYQKSDKPEKALEDFNKAIAVDSKFWEAYYNRAELLFNLGNYQEAIQDLNKIGKVYKDSSFYYVTLGNVKTQTQDYSGATAAYERALVLDPKNAEAYTNHGYLYFEQNNYPLAKRISKRL
jgi:tetratricopeptide (TPR) repeat protein